jgi:hypothetical protein
MDPPESHLRTRPTPAPHRATLTEPSPTHHPIDQAQSWCQTDPDLLTELLALLDSDSFVEKLLQASTSTVDPKPISGATAPPMEPLPPSKTTN